MSLMFMSVPSIVPPVFNISNVSVSRLSTGCQLSVGFKVIYAFYAFTNLLLLPLYVFILCLGFQRWRRQPSAAAGAAISHSDFFTYQMMIAGIFDVFGSTLVVLGNHLESQTTFLVGGYLLGFVVPSQTFFHVLTCVEHYAAVVHAITYMNLKDAVKVRVRNISTAAAWLIGSGFSTSMIIYLSTFPTYVLLPCLAICLIVTLFCCLSVLHFLRRPKPGGARGNQQNQSKKRAFNLILAITATLALRMLGILLSAGVKNFISADSEYLCTLMDSGVWLLLPSNLVLPLLFLHRAGKL